MEEWASQVRRTRGFWFGDPGPSWCLHAKPGFPNASHIGGALVSNANWGRGFSGRTIKLVKDGAKEGRRCFRYPPNTHWGLHVCSTETFVLEPACVCFCMLVQKIHIYGCDTFVFDLHTRTGLVLRHTHVHTQTACAHARQHLCVCDTVAAEERVIRGVTRVCGG